MMDDFNYVIVDGYNVINSWQCLTRLRNKSLEFKRLSLISTLQNFSDYTGKEISIVFDGNGAKELSKKEGSLSIVFSKKCETADTVIERLVYNEKDRTKILVATNDRTEQNMIFGMGATFINSADFEVKIFSILQCLKDSYEQKNN